MRGDLIVYWNAYQELARTRSYGFNGPNHITYQEANAWLDAHGYFDTDMRLDYIDIIMAIDDKAFQRLGEQQEAENNAEPESSDRRPESQARSRRVR